MAGVVEERGPVDRLRQQLRRPVKRAERQARGRRRRLVRHSCRDRQHAEHARRNAGVVLGQPAQAGDARSGIACGAGVELGRAEGGPFEGERRAPVGAGQAGACPVEHLQRFPQAALDLQYAAQRESDRDLSGRIRRGIQCLRQMSRRLRVSRV
jgi:hypothetical protein